VNCEIGDTFGASIAMHYEADCTVTHAMKIYFYCEFYLPDNQYCRTN